MKTRNIFLAIALISVGIVFGVVLVSGLKGVDISFAQEEPKIGNARQAPAADVNLQTLNKAFTNVSEVVTPSVVYINVRSTPRADEGQNDIERFFPWFSPNVPRRPELGTGSGVLITKDGYILTNNHVVQNADEDGIRVILWDSREYKGTLVGTDETTDLAVIKIDAEDLPACYVGNSDEVKVGNIVFAVGNPLGLTSTVTMGIVSATGRNIGIIEDARGYGIENFIQTDAAINPGNSGGALVNINGEVVGINTAIASTNARYQGYGFAIPMNLGKRVATDLIKYKRVRRGYIGVRISTVDATIAKSIGLDKPRGVLVESVNPNSAGEEAGIKPRDVILSVDGYNVNTAQSLQTAIASKYPGQKAQLKVYRSGKTSDVTVTLKGLEGQEGEFASADSDPESGETAARSEAGVPSAEFKELGFSVKNLDSRTRRELGLNHGVLVASVEPYGEAMARRLRANDIVLEYGDSKITSVAQLKKYLDGLKAGDAVLLRVQRGKDQQFFVALELPK